MTEWGQYQYKRASMGLISSGDEFCARSDRALANSPGVFKLWTIYSFTPRATENCSNA